MHLVKNVKWRNRLQGENLWSFILGTGMVLFVVHNPNLIGYTKTGGAELFLPVIGFFMVAGAVIMLMPKKVDLGKRIVYVPLLVIVASIAMSGFLNSSSLYEAVAPGLFALILFGVYLIAYNVGARIFRPFLYAVIIETVSLVIMGIINPGIRGGGIISPTNYDIAAGLLVFGLVVSAVKHQWWLSTIAVIGIFFTGAEEGLFALAVLAITVALKRDISRKGLVTLITGVVLIVVGLATPTGQGLYRLTLERLDMAQAAIFTGQTILEHEKLEYEGNPDNLTADEKMELATGYRWLTHWKISEIKPFGHGFVMTEFYYGIPHNIILIIIEQVGISAALAWLFLTVYCLIKTRWKYAWVAILALGVFDHYLWTQAAMWWWALVGVSTISKREGDKE